MTQRFGILMSDVTLRLTFYPPLHFFFSISIRWRKKRRKRTCDAGVGMAELKTKEAWLELLDGVDNCLFDCDGG